MARYRPPKYCPNCNKQLVGLYRDQSNVPVLHRLIGDTFIGYKECDCTKPSNEPNEQEKEDQYEKAVKDVLNEVRRAKTMFKDDFVNQHEGYAVILEELDELWDEVKKNQKNYDLIAQRKEAIQCAAMCIRFIAELTPSQ